MLSPIGFGAFKIGRNQNVKYAQGYDLPTDDEVSRLLNGVLDLGINYIDTAPAYGSSEERIGRAIGHRNLEFMISTKVGETFDNNRSTYDFSANAIRRSVTQSLTRLKRDRLDIVFVHSDGSDLHILNNTDVVPTLQSLKAQGLISAIGFSGKTTNGAAAALDWADSIMIEYHVEDRSHEPVIAEAARRGVGVIVKKPLASGRLQPASAIPFILANPNVTSMIVGGLTLDHIRQNVRTAATMSKPSPV
ncbi:MAG: aldo/keto reductase [Phycisphaerales bacterium]|nr:aldo/keto reductase [Phycisphaerales bacterium]MCI0677288.1 aldo/keto reductase [Phycisphaerales bacterium]